MTYPTDEQVEAPMPRSLICDHHDHASAWELASADEPNSLADWLRSKIEKEE